MSLVVLAELVAGYLLILATPGPNMFAVAGMATVRGLRGALPFCLGLALGGGALCAVLMCATHLDYRPDKMMRLAAAVLLLWVGSGLLRGRARDGGQTRSRAMMALGAGFATASVSPMSAAYFLSIAIEERAQPQLQTMFPAAVALTAAIYYVAVASILATSSARRVALVWDRPIRVGATVVIAWMAMRMAWPLLAG